MEDTSLAALLAGNGLPADSGAELRPVADVLAALTARPGSDELAGLAAAQAEFRRRAAVPAQVWQSRRWRLFGLASRLGVRAAAAAAVVIMGFGGAAAAAYSGALPSSWQQFAHREIGAPAHGAPRQTPATTGAARRAAHPASRHPAYRANSGGPPARYEPPHYTRPPLHAGPAAARPFRHLGRAPYFPAEDRWPPLPPSITHWPARTEQTGPGTSASNAGGTRGVS